MATQLKLYINGQADTVTSVHLVTEPLDGRIGNLVRKSSDFGRVQNMPHIWHEFNNVYAGSLPDLTIAAKYTGVIRDNDCVAFHVREIADYGLTQRYPDIRQRSIDVFLAVPEGLLRGRAQIPDSGRLQLLADDRSAGRG